MSTEPLLPAGTAPSLPPAQAPAAPPPAQAPAPAAQNTVKLDIEVPDGATVGDRLTFSTGAGQFSLVVPIGATAGKKMMVTMPVPANFPPGQQLVVSGLRINGQLPPPKFSAEHMAMSKAHRALVDVHWLKFGAHERKQVHLVLEMAQYKPQHEATVMQQWGFWKLPTAIKHVPLASNWVAGEPRQLAQTPFACWGARWEFSLEATAEAPKHGCTELMFQAVLRRLKPSEPGEALGALSFWVHLELADRWSNWTRATLSPGEDYVFDLGDRRAVHTLKKWHESCVKGELRMTATTPGMGHVQTAAAMPGAVMVDPASALNMKRKLEQTVVPQQPVR